MIQKFKNLLLTLLLVVTSAAGAWAQVTAAAPAVGDGSSSAPYEISSPAEFKWFFQEGITANPGACAVLTQDIDLSKVCYYNNSWNPVDVQYSGTFDGQNHVIDKFFTNRSSDYVGLFRYLHGATVRNIKFAHVDISNARQNVGTVAAWVEGATLQNIHILEGGSIDGQKWVGGLVGKGYCHITDCSSHAYVRSDQGNGGSMVGGDWEDGTSAESPEKQLIVERCINAGRVVAQTRYDSNVVIGGIVGTLRYGSVSNCVTLPSASGPTGNWSGVTGGIVGRVDLIVGCPVTIENCLNLNNVGAFYNYGDGTGQILGSVMYNGASGVTLPTVTIRDCYWSSKATLSNNTTDRTNRISSHAYSELKEPKAEIIETRTGALTPEQLASGHAAYVLQSNQVGTQWGHDLSASEAYPTPRADHQVYLDGYITCGGTTQGTYSNTPGGVGEVRDHAYVDGVCTECHALDVPALVGDTYQISNGGQLKWWADVVNAGNFRYNATLTADINLSGVCGEGVGNWRPICKDWSDSYFGIFNGGGHTITGLYYHSDESIDNIGLFGYVKGSSSVTNVRFAEVDIQAPKSNNVGALAGTLESSVSPPVEHISVLSGSVSGNNYVGGIGGLMKNGVFNCLSNEATVSGNVNVGGIGGEISGTVTVNNVSNHGNVVANPDINGESRAAGIAGFASNATFSRCFNDGTVTGRDKVAGIVAYAGSSAIHIYDCINDGNITALTCAGGITGYVNVPKSDVARCYNRGNVTITSTSYSYNNNFYGAGSIGAYLYTVNSIPSYTDCYIDPSCKIFDKDGEHAPVGYGYQDNSSFTGRILGISIADAADLNSGALAYRLQADRDDAVYWSQQLPVEHWPMVNYSGDLDKRVYADGTFHCSGEFEGQYTNTPCDPAVQAHTFNADGLCSVCGGFAEPVKDGDYYLIANVGNLLWFRDQINLAHKTGVYGRQTADLDLSVVCGESKGNWVPIGATDLFVDGFHACRYDGGGYTISGLYIDDTETTTKCQGLFGLIDSSRLTGINLTNVHINVPNCVNVGALCGQYQGVDNVMTNIHVGTGSIRGMRYVGGLIGYCLTSINGASNEASVEATQEQAGGIAGYSSNNRRFTNCYNKGNVTATSQYAGGIIARASQVTISKCRVDGNVTTPQYAGGVVGGLVDTDGAIEDCIVYGNVTATDNYAGGISQSVGSNVVAHCLFAGNVTNNGSSTECGLIVGTGFSNLSECYYSETSKMYRHGEEVAPAGTYSAAIEPAGMHRATTADLTGGAIAYRLQDGRAGDPVWGQNIDQSGEHDAMPQLNIASGAAPRVYMKSGTDNCAGEIVEAATYSNTEAGSTAIHLGHTFDAQHYCTTCHIGQEPAQDGDVYQVGTYGELVWVRDHVNGSAVPTTCNVVLTADIDMAPYVGVEKGSFIPFRNYKGKFDGAGHAIRGFYADFDKLPISVVYRGFFSNTNTSTTYELCNLELEGDVVATTIYSALLAGWAGTGETLISNCVTRGSVTGDQLAGGLVCYLNGSAAVVGCTNYATVNGKANIGGLVASSYSRIEESTNYGAVNGTSTVGGVCGYMQGVSGAATNVANYGTVTATDRYVGGIFGYVSSNSSQKNLANYGDILCQSEYAGGIAGYGGSIKYENAFNGGNVTITTTYTNVGPLFGYHFNKANLSNLYYATDIKVMKNGEEMELGATDRYDNTGVSPEELATGATTYALGAGWGQRLGTDRYPVLGSKATVYYGTHRHAVSEAISLTPIYSNDILTDGYEDHDFKNGFCTVCGKSDGYLYDDSGFVDIDWTNDNRGKHGSRSTKEYNLTAEEGDQLTFDWTVDSEASYDKLTVKLYPGSTSATPIILVDGVSGLRQSGNVDITFSASDAKYKPGTYVLYIEYYKDGSGDGGSDTATVKGSFGSLVVVGTYGDLDGDDDFDVNDVNIIRSMVLGQTSVDLKADLNGDGKVTIGDIVEAVRQLILP